MWLRGAGRLTAHFKGWQVVRNIDYLGVESVRKIPHGVRAWRSTEHGEREARGSSEVGVEWDRDQERERSVPRGTGDFSEQS